MNVLNFILLSFSQYLLGWSVLYFIGFKNAAESLQLSLMSLIIGLGFYSLLPVILEMLGLPITNNSLFFIIIAVTALPAVLWVKSNKYSLLQTVRNYTKKIKLYDVVFLVILMYFLMMGFAKCAYFPPTPRDLTSGAEAIAEYTLKEEHINNSYFFVDLSSTDNYQKPPFLLGLQIIYKSFVQPFGQVWLIQLSLSFFLLLYLWTRKMVHPIFAGIATIMVLIVPEFYAYATILPLFDFPNTVYLFAGFYYLYQFLISSDHKYVLLSSVGFGLATLARPETIILVAFICIIYYLWQIFATKKIFAKEAFIVCFILLLTPILIDIFTMEIFVKRFLPASLNIAGKFNPDLSNFTPLIERFNMLTKKLMFSNFTASGNATKLYYAETFNLMIIFIAAEIIAIVMFRKFDFKASFWLLSIILVFLLLNVIGYLLLWTEFTNAKRGLFKLIPLIFVFGINTRAIQYLSQKISNWEHGIKL